MTATDHRGPEEGHQSCASRSSAAPGLIGSRLVTRLTADDHDVVVASRATGVNSYTGEGLADALEGAEALIDVSNSDYLDERGANDFFYGSTLNLIHDGAAAGVHHHVALSVVGTDRLARTEHGYFAAKAAQEQLIRRSGKPYSIVHATQFFEYIPRLADASTSGNTVRLSHALIQPMAADDVVAAVATIAVGSPVNGVVEFAAPSSSGSRRSCGPSCMSAGTRVRSSATRPRGTSAPTSTSASCFPAPRRPSRRRGSTTGSRAAGSPPAPPAARPQLRRGGPRVSLSVRAPAFSA